MKKRARRNSSKLYGARLERRINSSVLANLDEKGDVFVSFSEKDRSTSSEFWSEVCEPLKTFLKNTPSLARQHLPATMKDGRIVHVPGPVADR